MEDESQFTLDDFQRWKVGALKDFLGARGLKKTGRKDELVALAYAAAYMKKPVLATAQEERDRHSIQYKKLLRYSSQLLPDPLSELKEGWLGECRGVLSWPPTSIVEIAEHLNNLDGNFSASGSGSNSCSTLQKRLLRDYKEGKAYSYFDAQFLKEVFYHGITADSEVCFLMAQCTPSQRVCETAHRVWVCIQKASGKIHSAYCSCLAGLGSTCNHVAALLFKVEFAYSYGWTSKSCTSLPCSWNRFSGGKVLKEITEGKRISEMDWRKPHYRKGDSRENINPAARQSFQPSPREPSPSITRITQALNSTILISSIAPYLKLDAPPQSSPCEDFNVQCMTEVETSPDQHVPLSLPELATNCSCVNEFQKKLTQYTPEEVKVIEQKTKGQNSNPLWHTQRQGRITSSNVHGVVTRMRHLKHYSSANGSALIKRIMGYNAPYPELPSLKFGRDHENKARQMYTEVMTKMGHKNVRVEECGLFVSKGYPFLGSSPDGVRK